MIVNRVAARNSCVGYETMCWLEPDASTKRGGHTYTTSLVCPNSDVHQVTSYQSRASGCTAASRIAGGVGVVYGALSACERGRRITEVLARSRSDYIGSSFEHSCHDGSVCLWCPGRESVTSEELWDTCYGDAVLQTDGLAPEI